MTRADELEQEQRHLDVTYATFDALVRRLSAQRSFGVDEFADEALELMRRERLRVYVEASGPLYFGRIDLADGRTLYIGRHAVADQDNRLLSINWRAPAAEPFYAATADDPRGAILRRRLDIDDRRILDFVDETLRGDEEGTLHSAIAQDIAQQRVGEMRQIISTITPIQYGLITERAEGAVVVQGGPGTGKTAVGLHRAAWLLYRNPDLARAGVLVVGPNETFMRYISQVLPALGEGGVEQRAIHGLITQAHQQVPEPRVAAVLKGSGRMAEVLSRLAWSRLRVPEESLHVELGRVGVEVSPADVRALIEQVRGQSRTYDGGRERFRRRLAGLVVTRAHEAARAPVLADQDELLSAVRKSRDYRRTVTRCWPRLTADALLSGLFKNPARLRAVAGDLLSDEEIAELRALRPPDDRRRMSATDVALLDESRWLIDPEMRTFGHVVVDEAHNLTAMELRMVVRRACGQSLTLLGDIAQRTADAGLSTWEHVLTEAGVREHRVRDLQISYRVPDDFLRLAAAVIAPETVVPRGIRRAPWPAVAVRAARDQLAATAVDLALRMRDEVGSVGLIVGSGAWRDVRDALSAHDYVDATASPLSSAINLLDLHVVKGLEFDAVIVVEPAEIEAERPDGGAGGLYTALTRSTRALAIVHAGDLPARLHAAGDLRHVAASGAAAAWSALRRAGE